MKIFPFLTPEIFQREGVLKTSKLSDVLSIVKRIELMAWRATGLANALPILLGDISAGYGLRLMTVLLTFAFSVLPGTSHSTSAHGHLSSQDAMLSKMRARLDKFVIHPDADFAAFMQSQSGIYLPNPLRIDDDFSKLPAPPNRSFKGALKLYANTGFGPPAADDMVWLQKENVGALVATEGSAGCSYWFVFSSDGTHSFRIKSPKLFRVFLCGRDGTPYDQSASSLFKEDNQVFAVLFARTELKGNNFKYALSWQAVTSSSSGPIQSISIDAPGDIPPPDRPDNFQ